jgi:dolichol-phosphate mannosyltransferase
MTSLPYPSEFAAADRAPLSLIHEGPQPLDREVPHVFVVPAYNEEANLPRLLHDFEQRPELFPPLSRILIVDDGSQDGTAEIVERYDGPLPVQLIRFAENRGPGAAFRAGFDEALSVVPGEALVVTLEADTTSDLDALPEMIKRASDGAELVLASWVMLNVSRKRRTLSAAAGLVVRLALGLEAKTVSSFFRVYRASALRRAFSRYGDGLMREPGFACKAEILAKMARIGVRIEEVPVGLDSTRRVGESKMPVGRTMLAYWRMLGRQLFARDTPTA